MKITKYYCDFCKKEITTKPTYDIHGNCIHYELCKGCNDWVRKTLREKRDEKM